MGKTILLNGQTIQHVFLHKITKEFFDFWGIFDSNLTYSLDGDPALYPTGFQIVTSVADRSLRPPYWGLKTDVQSFSGVPHLVSKFLSLKVASGFRLFYGASCRVRWDEWSVRTLWYVACLLVVLIIYIIIVILSNHLSSIVYNNKMYDGWCATLQLRD